jgi:nitrate/TMAO reductase-like tetraheme cytochrome c subunit
MSAGAWAEGAPRVPLNAKYSQECSSCHVAFAPGMLPAVSWQRLMANLPKHFGTDASLDPATNKEIATWLNTNAGTYKRVTAAAPPDDRISRSPWFIRKHDEVAASVWQRPAIKSAANCSACHPQADKGDFNEHSVRIPK